MHGSYFRKLLLACLLVVFFCGSIIAVYSYVENVRLTEEEWKRNHTRLLEQFQDKIDLKLATVMNAIFNLRTRPELIEYARSNGENPYINTRVFQVMRSHIDVYLDGGYQIDVIKKEASIVITREYTLDIAGYEQALGLRVSSALEHFSNVDNYEYLSINNLAEWQSRAPDEDSSPETAHFLVILSNNRYDELLFLVTLSLEDLFANVRNDNERFAIMIGEELFAESEPFIDAAYGNHQRYEVSSLTIPSWSYTYHVQIPSFHSMNLLQTITVVLTMTVAGIVFSILIAFRTYRPVHQMIRKVRELAPEKLKPEIINKDEFFAVQSITSNMYLENQQLTSRLYEYRQPMREKLLRDLIIGILSRDEALQELDKHQLSHLISRSMSVALLYESDEMGLSLINQEIVDGIEQIVRSHDNDIEFFRMDNNRQALLILHNGDESPAAMLETIINQVHQTQPVRLTVSTGVAVEGILDAVTSYHSAVRVLEQLRPMNRKSLLTVADLKEGKHAEYYYPLDLERELVQSALAQNEIEVSNIIESLLRGIDFSRMDSTAYVQFIYSIQSTLQRIAQQLNCQITDIFDEMPFETLRQCTTQEEVLQELLDMFRRMMSVAEEKSKSLDQLLSETMTEFVHTHYHHDISLTDLAQYVKMSPSYISSIFKTHTGENFKDYLNKYRVEQAKLLIERGEHKVNLIATQVGCNNVNTFIRIFKKAEGISPGQYIALKYRGAEE